MKKTYIISACRTAIGAFGGALANVPAADLGAAVIGEAVKRANISPDHVDEVIMGIILAAGFGQNVVRQAALKAGIPQDVCASAINMLCGSGLKSIMLGRQSILAGDNDIVVVGGTENMSLAPYILPNARNGYKLGNGAVVDSMVNDGLTCAMNNIHMGITAENLAKKYDITREEQDAFAAESQRKAGIALESDRFADEIVPIEIKVRRDVIIFDKDEYPRPGTTVETLAKLRPAFLSTEEGGTVTAGNASGINDGAAALVIASEEAVKKYDLTPLAEILGTGQAGVDPAIMGIGPVEAVKKALASANLTLADIDLIEANEAFAAQSISVSRELNFDMSKVNVNGGAIALGHPIGASGARVLVTLLYEMQKRGAKHGLATLCVGGGMGVGIVVKNI
ncbi:MAG: acetyl-CoA C-acetyltransferase [Defluviitaleaceae bacterium]|nr:acetyl-CoA C-acetyltransferase [Defluviitaleaceae bacterium]